MNILKKFKIYMYDKWSPTTKLMFYLGAFAILIALFYGGTRITQIHFGSGDNVAGDKNVDDRDVTINLINPTINIPKDKFSSENIILNEFNEQIEFDGEIFFSVYVSKLKLNIDTVKKIANLDILIGAPSIIAIDAGISYGILNKNNKGEIVDEYPNIPLPIGAPTLRIYNAQGEYTITYLTKKIENNSTVNLIIS